MTTIICPDTLPSIFSQLLSAIKDTTGHTDAMGRIGHPVINGVRYQTTTPVKLAALVMVNNNLCTQKQAAELAGISYSVVNASVLKLQRILKYDASRNLNQDGRKILPGEPIEVGTLHDSVPQEYAQALARVKALMAGDQTHVLEIPNRFSGTVVTFGGWVYPRSLSAERIAGIHVLRHRSNVSYVEMGRLVGIPGPTLRSSHMQAESLMRHLETHKKKCVKMIQMLEPLCHQR